MKLDFWQSINITREKMPSYPCGFPQITSWTWCMTCLIFSFLPIFFAWKLSENAEIPDQISQVKHVSITTFHYKCVCLSQVYSSWVILPLGQSDLAVVSCHLYQTLLFIVLILLKVCLVLYYLICKALWSTLLIFNVL